MKRYLVLLAALLLVFPLARAQQGSGDPRAMIFRGKLVAPYTFLYNGNYFWDHDPEYTPGDIFYNGRRYEDVLLNIDAFTDQLTVRPGRQYAPVYADRDQVVWFTRKGHLFVNLRYLGVAEALPGFYQLLHDGAEPLFRRVEKEFQSNPGEKNGEVIGFTDPDYRTDVITYFAYKEEFYLLVDGALVRLRNLRSYRKLHPEQKGKARELLRSRATDPQNLGATLQLLAAELDREPGRITPLLGDWHPAGGEGVPPTLAVAPIVGARKELPAGYFLPQASRTAAQEETVQATYRNKVYEIGRKREGDSRTTAVVTGVVTDTEGARLPGVTIYDEQTNTYARTDRSGHYRITLPLGNNVLHFSEPTKDELDLKVILNGPGGFDVIMPEKITALRAATITAESMAEHRTTKIGLEKVSIKTIGKIPSAFGEGDVIKAVMTLPGVKSVGEASTGFNVRGGASDQNLILFNESTVYNPSHLFGIFSAFNPDVVESVELYKSSIPAEYGGRISSVLNVRSKEGDPGKVKGALGIGLLTSRFELEGPLAKNRTTFVTGGRITYSDWLLRQLPKNSGYAGGNAGFGDFNLGITHKPDSLNTLQAFGYFARDRFGFQGDTTFRYQSLNASLLWRHKLGKDHYLNVSTGYDQFGNTLEDRALLTGCRLETQVRQAFLKAGITDVNGAHTLSYGVQAVGYGFDPGRLDPLDGYVLDEAGEKQPVPSAVEARRLPQEYALEPAVYFGDTWTFSEVLSLDLGARLSGFVAGGPTLYGGPEVRFSGKYSPKDNLSFKAGINTMKQYIHLISNTASISPMDTWKLSGKGIRPTDGYQLAGGAYWTVFNSQVDLSLEGYWKQMFRYHDYKSGATLAMNPNLADDLVEVEGKAYGVEVMAKKSAGKLNGWISYSYSRTLLREMEDRGLETIAGGKWYCAAHDKPHDVKMALNYKFTHRYSLSVNLDYSTGRPVTVPTGKYRYQNGYRLLYSERNAYRIPDYFRLDAAINIDPGHYLKALTHSSITIGVYNITGRKNPYSVFFTTDHGARIQGYMVSVFAMPIPYINLNLLF